MYKVEWGRQALFLYLARISCGGSAAGPSGKSHECTEIWDRGRLNIS